MERHNRLQTLVKCFECYIASVDGECSIRVVPVLLTCYDVKHLLPLDRDNYHRMHIYEKALFDAVESMLDTKFEKLLEVRKEV